MKAMILLMPLSVPPPLPKVLPKGHVTLTSMTLVYLKFLRLGLVYFLQITRNLLRLKIKTKPTKNNSNLLNHQNDVICFKYDGEKTLYVNE